MIEEEQLDCVRILNVYRTKKMTRTRTTIHACIKKMKSKMWEGKAEVQHQVPEIPCQVFCLAQELVPSDWMQRELRPPLLGSCLEKPTHLPIFPAKFFCLFEFLNLFNNSYKTRQIVCIYTRVVFSFESNMILYN